MKRIINDFLIFLMAIIMMTPMIAHADSVNEEYIVFGADLTDLQRDRLHKTVFKADKMAHILEVTNAEEHKYLDGIIPKTKIGTKAISSVYLKELKEGSGLDVKVGNNINYISTSTYRNALITAGINDAKVIVDAPIEVSGTAALTGIMKAYEKSSGKNISDEKKRIANEELVVSQGISEDIGDEKTDDLINSIKLQIAENAPKDEKEVRVIINNISNQYNLNLTDAQIDKLVSLFTKMKDSDIDWNKVEEGVKKYSKVAKQYSKKAKDYLSSDEGQQMLENSKSWFARFIDWIKSLFK